MAKKNKSKASAPKPKKERGSKTRRVYERAKSGSKKTGLRWGEIALSAIVGYEGDKIMEPGIAAIPFDWMSNPYTSQIVDQYYASTGNDYLAIAKGVNKLAGLAAILKGGYDVVKHKRLSETDKNILIPYGIGTIFDASKPSSGNAGGWK